MVARAEILARGSSTRDCCGGDLNVNTTLIAQIQAVQAESAAIQDPRLALEAKQQPEPLPEPQPPVVELLDITGEIMPVPAGEPS